MKLSIIVPVYNTEKYVNKCVDSILNQSFKDYECILVDDGSTDNCGFICDEYSKKDDRVRVIHKENGGLSSARNAGIDISQGDYIAFVDSDDWIDTEMYENMIDIAQNYNADIVQCMYRFHRPWKTQNKILEKDTTNEINIFTNIEALQKLYFGTQLFSDISIMVWNKIYKREIFSNIRFKEGIFNEDVEITPKLLFSVKKVAQYDRTFYNYNIHLSEGQFSALRLNPLKIESGICARQSVADYFSLHYVDKISDYTKSAFFDSLLEGYYGYKTLKKNDKCYSIKNKLCEYKKDIFYNPYTSKKRFRLFFMSPLLFVKIVKTLRRTREYKYKMRVLFTGRN